MRPTSRIARGTPLAAAMACVVGLSVTGSTVATAQTTYAGCRTGQLTVWRGEPGTLAAGSAYYELQFSNVSKTTCSLYGFPGVSAVNGRGRQLGRPAAWQRQSSPNEVVLAPGTTAHVGLRIADVTDFPPTRCRPTTAAALKIYPPNRRHAVILPFRFRACAKAGPVYMSMHPTRPRAGIPGYSR